MYPLTAPRIRQKFLTLVAAALIAIGGLTTAAPAHAADLGTFDYDGTSIVIEGAALDTFSIRASVGTTAAYLVNSTGQLKNNAGQLCDGSGTGGSTRCRVDSALGLIPFSIDTLGEVLVYRLSDRTLISGVTITLVAPSPGATSGGSTPAPLIQQFGKPASGTCDAAASAALNWGGAASGGWSESWAEWMNSGSGGAVCTRTLIYSNRLGAWTVT